ncbi:hypothetical protein X777_07492 [Ooceraea biroi]|nr:hypothetical protein X777_07492 [Ooceraea biroi]
MPQMPFGIITVYVIIQMMVVYKVINTLAPAEEHPKVCSRLHSVWKRLGQLRNERREIYQFLLCSVAIGLWLFGRISSSSSRNTIYWSIIFAPPVLRLPLRISEMITTYLRSHGDWRCDSDIEDEFLPVVTEANLQVLNRVGETGDRSPTPTLTSALWDDFNGPLNDEDLVEGLNIPSHEEGSTDGVELSELELSVSENDAEENDMKFQAGHFEKSSSSSSEEEILDSNKISAVSSDESNGDSDFEIIDKEEVAKIKI